MAVMLIMSPFARAGGITVIVYCRDRFARHDAISVETF